MVTYPTTTTTADEILNTVAAEVGLEEVSDPVGSADASYKQLVRLLNVAGDELSVMYNWEVLRREHTFTTAAADVGNYALPTDFTHIVDSTVWDRTEDEPMFGPLSAQEWQALLGEDTTTISTLGWRIMGGEFYVYPYNPVGLIRAVYFEYVSNNWIVATNGTTYKNKVTVNSDVILYNRLLISRYTKLKFLLARGLDANAAQDDFNQMFELLSGQDKGAPVLNVGASSGPFPLINAWRNIGDSNFGS
tara:strand:+ start:9282 stop:10025 length:744 start_codon:yes stop_codon:yes gene_type:complete